MLQAFSLTAGLTLPSHTSQPRNFSGLFLTNVTWLWWLDGPIPLLVDDYGELYCILPEILGIIKIHDGNSSNLQGGGDPWGSKPLLAETSPSVESLELWSLFFHAFYLWQKSMKRAEQGPGDLVHLWDRIEANPTCTMKGLPGCLWDHTMSSRNCLKM